MAAALIPVTKQDRAAFFQVRWPVSSRKRQAVPGMALNPKYSTCNGSEHAGLATARGSHNEQGVAGLKRHVQVAAQLQRLGRREHVE